MDLEGEEPGEEPGEDSKCIFCVLCAACGVLDLCVYYVPQARAEAAVKLLRRNDVGLEIFTFLVCGGQVKRGEQTATMYDAEPVKAGL